MATNLAVELVCRSENIIVGHVVLSGEAQVGDTVKLTALKITKGMKNRDLARVPTNQMILDGVQMTCGHCFGNLWLRGTDGELFPAMPGEMSVVAQ